MKLCTIPSTVIFILPAGFRKSLELYSPLFKLSASFPEPTSIKIVPEFNFL